MGRGRKRLAALALAGVMCLSLAACGTKMTAFDAATYVKGLLDETYKESWDAVYLDLAGITEAEAQKAYDEGLEQEYQRFCYQFNLRDAYLTDETRESVQDLLKTVCARASYSVKPAVALDSTRYAVEVSVRPLDLFLQVRADDLTSYATSFQEAYKNVNVGGMEAKDREAFWEKYENAWANGVVKLCTDKLGIANYLDVEQILVLVAPDDGGLYGMGDNDFGNLSALILPY